MAFAIDGITRRHEILRSVFPCGDAGPIQRVASAVKTHLPLIDLSALPRARRNSEMNRVLTEKSTAPFVLDRGPLIQPHLIKLGKAEHVLLLVLHQIVCDGWSMNLLLRELAAIYRSAISGKAARVA